MGSYHTCGHKKTPILRYGSTTVRAFVQERKYRYKHNTSCLLCAKKTFLKRMMKLLGSIPKDVAGMGLRAFPRDTFQTIVERA